MINKCACMMNIPGTHNKIHQKYDNLLFILVYGWHGCIMQTIWMETEINKLFFLLSTSANPKELSQRVDS